MSTLVAVAAVAGMFLLLIGPHEAGHFALAKLFKVRVIEFSIGAGTKLWSTTRDGTLYALRAFPILGYVRMGGMEAGDFEDPNGFHHKAPWKRILILLAGPATNFLVAIVLFTGLGLTQVNSDPGKVANVVPGTPAARTGFVVGDRITTVNGKPISPGYIRKVEDAAPGAPLTLAGVHANGTPFAYVIAPACDLNNRCLIGVGVAPVVTVQSAVTDGIVFPYRAVSEIVTGIWSLITGQVPGGVFGPQGFTGPIGIADVTVGAVNQGPPTYIFLVALLSVALGFTNLLPLLALDGGRVVVVILEVLRRRPFDRASELNFQRVGLATLLGLAAVISFLDIQRIATGQFPGFSH